MPNPKGHPATLKPPKKGERGAGGSNGGRQKGTPNKVTNERIEKEVARIALMDPIEYFAITGGKAKRTCTLREVHAMSADARACIASIKVKTVNLTAGDGEQDTIVEVRFWDKVKALEMMMKRRGMFEKDNAQKASALEDLIAGSREGE